MRYLNKQFMDDLKCVKESLLGKLTGLLRKDYTLDCNIRDNQIHIYYRGGKIMDLKKSRNGYKAAWDKRYQKPESEEFWKGKNKLPSEIKEKADLDEWILNIPRLKQIMDINLSVGNGNNEREYQQLVVKENNIDRTANGTDYFIIDTEYKHKASCFDMVALKWPSKGHIRGLRGDYKPQLAFIEMKFGDGALIGNAGIRKHLDDLQEFLTDADNLENIKNEMIEMFKQKRALGLYPGLNGNKNEIVEISNEGKPEFILLFAGHDPESKILGRELGKIKLSEDSFFDLKIATANFTGYGLYQEAILDLSEFKSRFS